MVRHASLCRSTVSPVLVAPGTLRTFDTSTPLAARRSSAIWPSGSSPIREMKPTRAPSAARLCATIAEELPSVSIMRSASNSRSGGSSSGKPYRIRSRFSSPAMVTSKRGMVKLSERSVVVQNDNSAQVPRIIGVEALLQSGVETSELAGENIWRQPRQLRQVKAKLNQ